MKARRILSYIVDTIIAGVLAQLIVMLMFSIPAKELFSVGFLRAELRPELAVQLGVFILYFLTDGLYGRSPGKRLFGLRVVFNENKGSRLTTAIVRSVVKVLSISLLFGIIVFFIMPGDTSLHDRVAKTKVASE